MHTLTGHMHYSTTAVFVECMTITRDLDFPGSILRLVPSIKPGHKDMLRVLVQTKSSTGKT